MKKITPNGLSVDQLKKDAKKISRINAIPLSEAQNLIVRQKTSFYNWHSMSHALNNSGESIAKLCYLGSNKIKQSFVIYMKKPITLLCAPPGYGKSLWISQFIEHSLCKNILYCSVDSAKEGFGLLYKHLNGKTNLTITDYVFEIKKEHPVTLYDLFSNAIKDQIKPCYDLVIIDEYQRLHKDNKSIDELVELCSKFKIPIIISSQFLTDEEWKIHKRHTSHAFLSKDDKLFKIPEIDRKEVSLHKPDMLDVTHASFVDKRYKLTSFSDFSDVSDFN